MCSHENVSVAQSYIPKTAIKVLNPFEVFSKKNLKEKPIFSWNINFHNIESMVILVWIVNECEMIVHLSIVAQMYHT